MPIFFYKVAHTFNPSGAGREDTFPASGFTGGYSHSALRAEELTAFQG